MVTYSNTPKIILAAMTFSFGLAATAAPAAATENSRISGYQLRAAVEFDRATVPVVNLPEKIDIEVVEVPEVPVIETVEVSDEPEVLDTPAEEVVVSTVEQVVTGIELTNAVTTDWQRLIVVDPSTSEGWLVNEAGELISAFEVATGKAGLGNQGGSGKTPTGAMRVYNVVQGEYQEILKAKSPTGRIAKIDQGTAYVTTALLALDGLEDTNNNTSWRNIYLHGSNMVSSIGEGAQSGGCVRLLPEVAYELADQAEQFETIVYVLDRAWEAEEI